MSEFSQFPETSDQSERFEKFSLEEAEYRKMLETSLAKIRLDRIEQSQLPFDELFYPLTVDEGKYAFLSYMEQMGHTAELTEDEQEDEEITHDRGKREAIISVLAGISQDAVASEIPEASSLDVPNLICFEGDSSLDDQGEDMDIKDDLPEMSSPATGVLFAHRGQPLRKREQIWSAYMADMETKYMPPFPLDLDLTSNEDGSKPEYLAHLSVAAEMKSSDASVRRNRRDVIKVTLPPDIRHVLDEEAKESLEAEVGAYLPNQANLLTMEEHLAEELQHTVMPVRASDEADEQSSAELQNKKDIDTIENKWWGGAGRRRGDVSFRSISHDLLLENRPEWRHSLSLPDGYQRLLIIASAGHGKSTLLRRLAYYYCDVTRDSPYDLELREAYHLEHHGRPIPCLVYLRRLADVPDNRDNMVMAALAAGVHDVVWNDICETYPRQGKPIPSQQVVFYTVEEWVEQNAGRMLLLLDGLDELPEGLRCDFLKDLDMFLAKYPSAQIMMTSRVAGLLAAGDKASCTDGMGEQHEDIMEMLYRMKFKGRSIIPLDDQSAEAYALRWIKVTQPEDQQPLLREALKKVQTQRKFAYIKTFMRTPLELLTVLKQLTRDMLSLNRSEMFRDMMWHLVTNHLDGTNHKQAVFDDTMTLLSFLAYDMQLKERLYLTREEIQGLEEALSNLPFYTEVVGEDYAEVPKVLAFLDDLSANVGIIERDERTNVVSYTFPIRSYQEYLCAYACTHLPLDEDMTPTDILQKYMDNHHWWGIINFALSDLQQNNDVAFDILIRQVFARKKSGELVRVVLEANPTITMEHAMLFCRQFFETTELSLAQRDLIMTCMETKSAYLYPYALLTLRGKRENATSMCYMDALARTSVIQGLHSRQLTAEKLADDLESTDPERQLLGACMAYAWAEACLGVSLMPYRRQARNAMPQVPSRLQEALCKGVSENHEQLAPYCARALALLYAYGKNGGASFCLNMDFDVKYQLYCQIEEANKQLMAALNRPEEMAELDGFLISFMDDLYTLGLLLQAEEAEENTQLGTLTVRYLQMVIRGYQRAISPENVFGEYLRIAAQKQNIEW